MKIKIFVLLWVHVTMFSATWLRGQCQIEFEGVDDQGREILAIQEELLFSFTSDEVEDYVRERDFIEAYAQVVEIDHKEYLSLRINLASINAPQYYGQVLIGQPIKITFIDREPTYLEIVYSAAPQVDAQAIETTYEITARIEGPSLKALRKCELDEIGLVWTSGYETYPIYHVDFLKQQLACLKKHK